MQDLAHTHVRTRTWEEGLDVHDHACLIYDDRDEMLRQAARFLRSGLNAGDLCVCIDSEENIEAIRRRLTVEEFDLDAALKTGRLTLHPSREDFLQDGHFDRERMVSRFEALVGKAREMDLRAMRCFIGGEHLLGGQDGWSALAEYESLANHFYLENHAMAVCAYAADGLDPHGLHDVIMGHPLVIFEGALHQNPYYVGPCSCGKHGSDRSASQLLDQVRQWHEIRMAAEDRDRTAGSLRNVMVELAAVHASVPVAMIILDEDLRVSKINEIAGRLAGKDPDDAMGLPGGQVLHCLNRLDHPEGCGYGPHCPDCVIRHCVTDTLETQTDHRNVEAWVPVTDNDPAGSICLLVSTTLLNIGGRRQVLVCAQDITENKLAERKLLDAERIYKTILQAIPMGVFLAREGRYIYANPAAAAVLGHADPAALLGRSVEEGFDPAHHEELQRRLANAGDGVANRPKTFKLIRPDGSTHYVESASTPIGLLDGPATLLLGKDVTAQRETQQALEESNRRFSSILEAVNMAAVTLDPAGRITYANPFLCQCTGRRPTEILGRDWFEIFIPEDQREDLRGLFKQAIAENAIAENMENDILTADGKRRLIVWSNVMLHAHDGSVTGIACLGMDITDHRQLQAQFLQAQKMEAVGRLAAGVAHDFNNQLTVIQGYSEMLMMLEQADPRQRKALTEIHRAAERAHSTTSHLLGFSRRQTLKAQPLRVEQLLDSMRGPVSRMIGEDVRLSVETDENLPPVLVDPQALQQALMNLIINSRDAMPEGGELVLRAAVEAPAAPGATPRVAVSVRDTGCGMDDATKARIFEPFFTTKDPGKGTGLGLPMVQGFVRQSRGRLEVDSAPGCGATVSILLPASDIQPEDHDQVPDPATIEDCSGGETILVAEDERAVRQFIAGVLRQAGYRVLEAANATEAFAMGQAGDGRVRLLLSDLRMPDMDGQELWNKLREEIPTLHCVLLTGYTDEDPGELPCLLLRKPFRTEKLLQAVRSTLDEAEDPSAAL